MADSSHDNYKKDMFFPLPLDWGSWRGYKIFPLCSVLWSSWTAISAGISCLLIGHTRPLTRPMGGGQCQRFLLWRTHLDNSQQGRHIADVHVLMETQCDVPVVRATTENYNDEEGGEKWLRYSGFCDSGKVLVELILTDLKLLKLYSL